jgi:hypothetical protein
MHATAAGSAGITSVANMCVARRTSSAAAPLPLRLTSLSRAATRVLKRDIALCNKQAYGFTTKSSSVFILYCALIFGCVDR